MIDCIHQKKPRKLAKERDIGVGWGGERKKGRGKKGREERAVDR